MKVTMLGCGNSLGVPHIGCGCAVCTSKNPKNKRSRVSILIEINGINLVVDTSPDFREQMLRTNIKKIDAVLYTHDHADHVHGIDDLRQFNALQKDVIPLYSDAGTMDSIVKRFEYPFRPRPAADMIFRPSLVANSFAKAPVVEFMAAGQSVTAFEQQHGKTTSLGFRIGDFAYSTDTNGLSEAAFGALKGVRYWIVDCLRYTPSYSHSHLEMTLDWIKRVQPETAVLTHMSHEFDYDTLSNELPAGVLAGFDGLELEL